VGLENGGAVFVAFGEGGMGGGLDVKRRNALRYSALRVRGIDGIGGVGGCGGGLGWLEL
jgi:hypothetical protein